MLIDNMLAYAEVDEILNLLENKYKEKVPKKVRNFFKEERMSDYNPKIEVGKPLTEQNLKRETMVLLAILNINYWCDSEQEKQKFLDIKGTALFQKMHAAFYNNISPEEASKLNIAQGLYLKPEFIMGMYDAEIKIL